MENAGGTLAARDHAERLRRSVSSWERLHGVIVGFALTQAVRLFAEPWPTKGPGLLVSTTKGQLLIAFVVTLIPFFHGAQRHLEKVHIESPEVDRPKLLLFDYTMLLLEGAGFALLALAVNNEISFLHALRWLLWLDLVWATTTYLSLTLDPKKSWTLRNAFSKKKNDALGPWIVLDIFSLVALWALTAFIDIPYLSRVLVIGAVARTAIDYGYNWRFFLDRPKPHRTIGADTVAPPRVSNQLPGTVAKPLLRVAIESPLSGEYVKNTEFAKNVCKWASDEGYSPYAMHLFFTQFLDDTVQAERQQGINGGLAWVSVAEEVWFCLNADLETLKLSSGMQQALEYARKRDPAPRIRFRTFTQRGEPVSEYSSEAYDTRLN